MGLDGEDGDGDGDECADAEEGEFADGNEEEEEEEVRMRDAGLASACGAAPRAGAGASTTAVGTASPAVVQPQAPQPQGVMSLPAAYSFLLEHVPLHRYLVYQHLRSLGLVALRHAPSGSAPQLAAGAPPLLMHGRGYERHMYAPSDDQAARRQNSSGFAPAGGSSAASSIVSPAPSASSWLFSREADIAPDFDVYARDGISSFKVSAPGPPDFYVCVQT